MSLLEIENIHVAYGSLEVVKGVSVHVDAGEIVTILGSNGAGKTTTLRTVAGLLRPTAGTIRFAGSPINSLAPFAIANLGLALVPEGRQLFPDHTVLENLELGAYRRLRRGDRREFEADLATVYALFPRIEERLGQQAGSLSGGEQQMVAIARALVSRPKVLLLDEPSLGLAPILVRTIFDAFVKLRELGITILLVEQMAWIGLEVCDRAYVLESGTVKLAGTRDQLTANPAIMDAYLGRMDRH
jgi:branched-chain amino acid transport system ATP-binding protein